VLDDVAGLLLLFGAETEALGTLEEIWNRDGVFEEGLNEGRIALGNSVDFVTNEEGLDERRGGFVGTANEFEGAALTTDSDGAVDVEMPTRCVQRSPSKSGGHKQPG